MNIQYLLPQRDSSLDYEGIAAVTGTCEDLIVICSGYGMNLPQKFNLK